MGTMLQDRNLTAAEASVSALVFHHADCASFTAGEESAADAAD
jgi:hypothetical protein